jgi:hypothetical protein
MNDSVAKWKRVEDTVKRHETEHNLSYERQFLRHQENFMRITEKKVLFLEDKDSSTRDSRLIFAMENILLGIPTMFRLLGRTNQAESTAKSAMGLLRRIADKLSEADSHSLRLSLAKLTLLLFNIDFDLGRQPSVRNAFKEARKTLSSVFDVKSLVMQVF